MRKTVFFVGSLVTVSVLLIPLSTSRRRGSRGTHDRRDCPHPGDSSPTNVMKSNHACTDRTDPALRLGIR